MFTLFAALAVVDALVAFGSENVTAERVSTVKAIGAVALQVVAVSMLAIVVSRRTNPPVERRLFETIRSALTPYVVCALAVGFSLSLLYNAVACGEQSFMHGRRGEPLCKT